MRNAEKREERDGKGNTRARYKQRIDKRRIAMNQSEMQQSH